MQRLLLVLLGLWLVGSASLLGITWALERTAANPDYYAGAVNRISLKGFAVPLLGAAICLVAAVVTRRLNSEAAGA
ncbi:MAG: hypothetical protein OHK0011_27380 [Turneriella sp.]